MTVAELLAAGAAALGRREGLEDPVREARFLAARLLERSESFLFGHPEAEVSDEVAARFHSWVARRGGGEPAHRIVGSCPFWGREFLITEDALVPRPETELIVEHALHLPLRAPVRVLDVGTGSGCLATTLALELGGAIVIGTDVSLGALALARRNAARLAATVAFAAGDLTSHLAGSFDVVVANLPYIPSAEIAGLTPEVREFDPRLALDGGSDGASLLRCLLAALPALLTPTGRAILELGPDQAPMLAAELPDFGLIEIDRITDIAGIDRILVLEREGVRGPGSGVRRPTPPKTDEGT